MKFVDKDLISIQESRILVENAKEAQRQLNFFDQEKLNRAVEKVYSELENNIEKFSSIYIEETFYGKEDDEAKVTSLISKKVYERIVPLKCVGESKDGFEIGVPLGGVVLAVSAMNTVSAVITTSINCLKTGNALIICPDKRVVKTVTEITRIISEVLDSIGFPIGTIGNMETISEKGVEELIIGKNLPVVINCGARKLIDLCERSSKVFYYGGTSATPVFIEKTADVLEAVKNIILSRSFNNGILPGAEQYIVVDSSIIDEVKHTMYKYNAYFMNEDEEKKLISTLIKEGSIDEEYIGKSAYWLARQSGFKIPENTSVLVSEQDYVHEIDPYSQELNCPVLAIYKESDWMNACDKCMNLLANRNGGHSLSIYSKDNEIIKEFANKKPVGRILINVNATYGSMGIDTNLEPSIILGSFTRGKGVLSSNLSVKELVYNRQISSKKGITLLEQNNFKKSEIDFEDILQGLHKTIVSETKEVKSDSDKFNELIKEFKNLLYEMNN